MQEDLNFCLSNVKGLAYDSRSVKPGFVYFAIKGQNQDGNDFIPEAIKRGAFAVVTEDSLSQKFEEHCSVFVVSDILIAMAKFARKFFNNPDEDKKIFAITGTNGKTSISYLIKHLLKIPTAVIGTVNYDLVGKVLESKQTTPLAPDFFKILSEIPNHAAIALEVTSHALCLKRVYGANFLAGIFSNLTSDHLDFHLDRERYFLAKRKLFDGSNGSRPKINIINADDEYGRRLLKEIGGISYGIDSGDYRVRFLDGALEGTNFVLERSGKKFEGYLPLIGKHNLYNALAALSAVHETGEGTLPEILERLRSFPGVPGRLQSIKNKQSITVFVDYAHTEDGLKNVLESLVPFKKNKIITVFGCGGNRDRSKRSKMMAMAEKMSDIVFVTSDNSRNESIETIFADIKLGLRANENVFFEPDRKAAIFSALSLATEGDIVLIAGKGHEQFQLIGDQRFHFSDVEVVQEYFSQK